MRIKTILKSFLALPLLLTVVSCQDKLKTGFAKGEAVRFSIGTDAAGTKAAYSGQATDNIERIDWQEGDLIRIYCGAVSEPSDKFADYRVTSDITAGGSNSTAHIEGTGGVGLRWGEGDHTFYAVFPSPEDNGVVTGIDVTPYASGGVKSSVTTNINGATVTANLPAEQAVIGGIVETPSGSGNYIAAPDLKNMLMTAKSGPYTETSGIPEGPDVFLSFTPLTTAIKFTIENGTGAELALTDVQLISGNGKASADVINGAFSVDLDQTGIASGKEVQPFSGNAFKITYSRNYPLCTSALNTSTDMADRTLTISVGTDANPLKLAVNKKLTFTFFLNPCHDFNDLTFKLVKSGGSWMSTRLGYTDGDGVFFPRHKKSTVEGLLVPEGAQWRVSFAPDVTPWDDETETEIDLKNHATQFETFVTAWDEGVNDAVTMKSNTNVSVDGNVTMNFDATAGTSSFTVTSGSPWKLQYKDGDGNWLDAVANELIDGWIKFDEVQGTGGAAGKTINATVSPASGDPELIESNHALNLQSAPVKGTEEAPWDLSMHDIQGVSNASGATTANCYVITSPGWYALPLVYGNAIKNGANNSVAYNPTAGTSGVTYLTPFVDASGGGISSPYITGAVSAYPLWQDVADFKLIAESGCTLLSQTDAAAKGLIGCNCGYVMFEIKKENLVEGNAVIAVSNGSNILWSWHIWVTDADLTPLVVTNSAGQTLNMLPFNLGWVYGDANTTETGYPEKTLETRIALLNGSAIIRTYEMNARRNRHATTQTVVSGCCTFYQWGRKDPAIRLYKVGEQFKNYTEITPQPASFHGIDGFSDTPGTQDIDFTIKNPASWIKGEGDWNANRYRNLWSALNTKLGETAEGYSSKPTKTIYDPCPPGYQVPQANAFTGWTEGGYLEDGKGWRAVDIFIPAIGARSYVSWAETWNATSDFGGRLWTAIPWKDYLKNGVNPYNDNACATTFGNKDSADYFKTDQESDRACGFTIRPMAE